MARNFKISFPLPRRPAASPNTTPGSGYTSQSNIDDSPLYHPGSKAERTLGAADPYACETKTKTSRKERKQLRKYPSFMNVTLSEIDGEPHKGSDGFPFPSKYTSKETLRRPAMHLDRQGSSPSLGEQYFTPCEYIGSDISSQCSAPQAYRTGSSHTVTSHYDPMKSPLSISQQTSASSTRDMALRKGMPLASTSLMHSPEWTTYSKHHNKYHSPGISAGSAVSTKSKLSKGSTRLLTGLPRRRPSATDPPTLFPEEDQPFHAVSPPAALITSLVPKPLLKAAPTASFSRPKWWQRASTPQASPEIINDGPHSRQQPFEESFSSIKVNKKRPKSAIQGQRHWFDGLEDEEQTIEDLQHPEVANQRLHQMSIPSMNIQEVVMQELYPSQIASRKSSFSNKSQHPAPTGRKLSFRLDSPPSSRSQSALTAVSIDLSSPSESLGPTMPSSNFRAGIDLQTHSFLELSSSDEDDLDNGTPFVAFRPQQRHRIRASIERATYKSEVSISDAQRVQPYKPRSIVNLYSSRPTSDKHNSSWVIPPVPSLPMNPSRPGPNQRKSSLRWREILEERAASTESTEDNRECSVTNNHCNRSPSSPIRRKSSIRGDKLMKVTKDEEKLLEAMRDKRASIRRDDFEKGFQTAFELQDVVRRPKTAGSGGRISTVESCSSVYGSGNLLSPSSIQELRLRRTLASTRLSASTDDLISETAYPFPEIPPSLKSPAEFTSISKASPSPSFSPSDLLTSASGSHNSPVTPPASRGTPNLDHCCHIPLPGRDVLDSTQPGHERKRTMSSSVVMLDGVEHHARELDEANEISNWALDRW